MRSSYFLTIPKQHSNPLRIKEFEDKFLQQWVSQLPVANPGLSTRLLYDLILEMNALVMPPEFRLDSLELLQPVFCIVQSYLRSKLLKGYFPKDLNEQKALTLLVEVERQFSIGYWIAAKALTGTHIGWFKGKQAALSVQRCLRGLSRIVVNHYILGIPAPDWVWLDLHSLYKLSVKANIHNTQIPVVNNDGANSHSSLEECYLQIILLCLANPYGLMGKETLQVEKLSQKLIKLVKLQTTPVLGQADQCLIITDEDKPPFFQKQIAPDELALKTSSALLFVDFSSLYQFLAQNKLAVSKTQSRFSARGTDGSELITPELLLYLHERWSGVGMEGSELFADRLDRFITIGLVSTHKLLFSVVTTADDSELLAHSISGSLLSVEFDNPNALSVGSLLSLRKANEPKKQRLLAVVNQIFACRSNNKLNFGVNLLATQCIPTSYSARDNTANERHGPALLFKQGKTESTQIILDNSVFNEGDHLSLRVNQKEFRVMLHNKNNIALGYWQFTCERLKTKDPLES